MKKLSTLIFIILCIYIDFSNCKAFSTFIKNLEKQNNGLNTNTSIITSNDTKDLDEELLIYTPIKFSISGIRCFFKHKFNNPKYTQEVLPYSLSDLKQFLEYAKDSNQNRKFVKSIFKIFLQKAKNLELISAKEFLSFIKILPSYTKHFFIKQNNQANKETKVKDILYNEFLNKYQDFKTDPKNFFNNISKQICSSINESNSKDVTSGELSQLIIRFVECLTSKLAWPAKDNDKIWKQFKKLGQNIYNLKKEGIISDIDDINDLINGLISRLTIIIDISGSQIPLTVYKEAKEDLKNKKLSWLEIEEHDPLIISKQNNLLLALINGEIKSKANQEYGLVSEQII